jgi:hypothetical protein
MQRVTRLPTLRQRPKAGNMLAISPALLAYARVPVHRRRPLHVRSGNLVRAELHSTRLSRWLLIGSVPHVIGRLPNSVSSILLIADSTLVSAISTSPPRLDQIIGTCTDLHDITPHTTHPPSPSEETMCQSTSCSTCRKYPHPIITAPLPTYSTYLYLLHNLTVSLFSPQQKAQPGTAAAPTSPQSWTPCHRASAATADRRSRGTARCTLLEVSYLPLIPSLSLSLSIESGSMNAYSRNLLTQVLSAA